jgi:sugar/nucleoside kinase (ribokinase family)
MTILEEVSPQLVAEHRELLLGTGIMVADANLPGETLAAVADLAGDGPALALEAVSVEKAEKLLPFLGRATILAANRREIAHLSGLDLTSLEGWRQARHWHQNLGGQMLLLKLGSQGLFIGSQELCLHLPAQAAQAKDSTGAGDSLLGGFLAAIWGGASLDQAGHVALAVAQATLASPYSVARELTPSWIGEISCKSR